MVSLPLLYLSYQLLQLFQIHLFILNELRNNFGIGIIKILGNNFTNG